MDNFEDFIEEIKETSKNYVIICGFTDIKDDALINTNHYIMLGYADEKDIKEALSYIEELPEIEGEYEFDAVFRWVSDDYDDMGRITLRGYLEEKYTKFTLIQTLIQREREEKIDNFFDFNFD